MSLGEVTNFVQEGKKNTSSRWSKTPQQLKAAYLASLFGVCAGTLDGWTATAIPYLQQSEDSVLRITYHEASWIVSLYHLGSLFGAIPAVYLSNLLGRRFLILSLAVPMTGGWLMIFCGYNSTAFLYIARFFLGFTLGVFTVAYFLYSDEIAEDRVRGVVGTYFDVMVTVGMLYVYCCGAIISYEEMTIACTVLPILFALTFYRTPESPLYLLTRGRTEEAKKSLRWLRGVDNGHSAEIEREVDEMQNLINDPTYSKSLSSFFRRVFNSSNTAKNMKIVFGLIVFRQLCGMNAILAYTVYVFQTAGSSLDPYLCTAILGVAQFVSTLIASLMIRLDRKVKLPTFSAAAMGVCLLAILFHSLLNEGKEIQFLEWLPLISVNLYIISFSVGLGPAPWFVSSVRLSREDRVWVIVIAVCLNSLLAFFVTKFFPIMLNDFGSKASYGTLAVICLVGTIVIILVNWRSRAIRVQRSDNI